MMERLHTFQAVMNQSVSALMLNRNDIITDCSRSMSDFLGVSRDNIFGKKYSDFSLRT